MASSDPRLELFTRPEWQMALGERAAIAGVLAHVRPRLAVELGTAQGGSLRTIAEWSEEVHSFDFAPTVADPPANATLHAGDSHALLSHLLAGFAEQGRNVDFVLVDGDHSSAGVRPDVLDPLSSPAVGRSAIVVQTRPTGRSGPGFSASTSRRIRRSGSSTWRS